VHNVTERLIKSDVLERGGTLQKWRNKIKEKCFETATKMKEGRTITDAKR